MPYAAIAIAVSCAAFWYAAGEQELGSGLLWGGISLVISFPIILYVGDALNVFLANLGLFFAIALFRYVFDKNG